MSDEEEKRLEAIKTLSDFINVNAIHASERQWLHDCLSKLEQGCK